MTGDQTSREDERGSRKRNRAGSERENPQHQKKARDDDARGVRASLCREATAAMQSVGNGAHARRFTGPSAWFLRIVRGPLTRALAQGHAIRRSADRAPAFLRT